VFYREDKDGNIIRARLSDSENYKRNKKFIIINYKNNFILCDVHWNNNGQKHIEKKILKELNEKIKNITNYKF
jgi:hypothetical protein|tara:strand:- start:3367 stop:3585 length:219 start_codon:yes stop_codon:yes gene_type:complete